MGKLFEISIKFLNEVSFTAILKEGLKLWCVSLNEQSVGCVDVLGQCVHCIQWTSVSHRATAAEMTHVSQTDFMPLHKIVVQGDVQVSADTNLETCKSTSHNTFSISHRDIWSLACWVVQTVTYLMFIWVKDQTDITKNSGSLNVFCVQWTVAIQMMSSFSRCAPVCLGDRTSVEM